MSIKSDCQLSTSNNFWDFPLYEYLRVIVIIKWSANLKHYLLQVKDFLGPNKRSRKCSIKRGVLKNFSKLTGKHLCRGLILIKLQAWGLKLSKFGTGVFLQILRNFWERILYKTPPGDCFCNMPEVMDL